MAFYDESFLDTSLENIFEQYRPGRYTGGWQQAFLDPGSMYGYGAMGPYGEYFDQLKLDPSEWMQGRTALKERAGKMHGNIETQYGQGLRGLGEKSLLGIENIRGSQAKSGILGGAYDRMLERLRRSGAENVGDLSQKRGAQHMTVSDQISKEWSAYKGLIPSFLSQAANIAMGIRESSPTDQEIRYANANDVYNLSRQLSGEAQTGFVDRANQLISGGNFTYQSLIDLLADYQGGGTYG